MELAGKHCVPCEGGTAPLDGAAAEALLAELPGWTLSGDGKQIQRAWKAKNFATALTFLNQVGAIAEAEDHHPDLHLEGYRNVRIELSTHAIGGLSENDFIVAAKIGELSVP